MYCPGYLAQMPSVAEGMRAWAARRDGVLEAYYPNLEMIILDAADVATVSMNVYECSQAKKSASKV